MEKPPESDKMMVAQEALQSILLTVLTIRNQGDCFYFYELVG